MVEGSFLREAESRHRIIGELSKCFVDRHAQRYFEHTVQQLLVQRIDGIVLVYEDLNDHDRLRSATAQGRDGVDFTQMDTTAV